MAPNAKFGLKDPSTWRQLWLKNEKTDGHNFEKTFRLHIVKREDGSSVELWKVKTWILWRYRPPLKRIHKNPMS
jgi:hypothetical protein